jgi:site-specific DNA recombinase
VVRQMFAWYVDEGLSMHAIAARLTQSGIPTSQGRNHWNPATVKGILSNEVYAGTTYGNRDYEVEPLRWRGGRSAAEGQRHHTMHRPRDQWIAIDVPPIVSREIFQQVQALRPLRQAEARRNNTRHDYLLRPRVSCAVCGLAASGRPRGHHAYYICNGHLSRVQTGRAQYCSVRAIRVDRLDPMVWADVCRLLSNPAIITEALRRANRGELVQDDTRERLRHLQHARHTAERQVERLVDAFTAEVITLEELKVRRRGLEDRIRFLAQQEQDLRGQQQQNLRIDELCANIEVLCQGVRLGLHTLDFARRRQIIELLVDRVLISHDEIEVRYAIPLKGLNPPGQNGTLRLPYRADPGVGGQEPEAGQGLRVSSRDGGGFCLCLNGASHAAQAGKSDVRLFKLPLRGCVKSPLKQA